MTIEETRRTNLLRLLADWPEKCRRYALDPTDRAFATLIGVNPTYMSAIKAGTRRMGHRIARQIEERLSLPASYLDAPHPDLSSSDLDLINKIKDLPENQRAAVEALVRTLRGEQ